LTWKIEFKKSATKELRKLSTALQDDIVKYLKDRIATKEDPRRFGKPLSYDKHGLWCYRIQDARVICEIRNNELLVLVIRVGHRKDVYKFR
jgi:mRNA interferase RelE/StbE